MARNSWRRLGRGDRPWGHTAVLAALLAWTLVSTVSGCSSSRPKYDWAKTDASAADLEKARAECTKKAEDATAQDRRDWPAVHSMINVFLECMEEKGWELDAEDDDD